MSTGAAFQIIANDGKTDKVLNATDLLKQRICDIISERTSAGYQDVLPTIKDIERSHLIPFQSRFRPVVASAFEYQVIQSNSGSVAFGGNATFDLTPFGEFITDSVLNLNLSSCSYAAAAVGSAGTSLGPAVSGATSATSVNITLPSGLVVPSLENTTKNGDTVTIIRRLLFAGAVDENGQGVTSAMSLPDRAFYCDFPGERIIRSVTAVFCANNLDRYFTESYVFYRKTMLHVNKYAAYCRLMGQEVATEAISDTVGSDLGASSVRCVSKVVSGPQTPKALQPALSLWIMLLFNWCVDYKKPILCANIPSGQRQFLFEFATIDDIVFRGPAYWNKFILVEDLFGTPASLSSGTYTLVAATHYAFGGDVSNSWVVHFPVYTNGTLSPPTLNNAALYVNNIFTLAEIHDIYIDRIGFNLIRVHVRHTAGVNTSSNSLQLNNFKYPVEYFWFGIMRTSNRTGPAAGVNGTTRDNRADFWHRFTSPTRRMLLSTGNRSHVMAVATGATGTVSHTGAFVADVAADTRITLAQGNSSMMIEETSNITTLGIKVYAVDLYRSTNSRFFSDYIPYQYGGQNLKGSEDSGIMFVNFTYAPGDNQFGAYVNTSRVREFYVEYNSATIGSVDSNNATISGTVHAEGSALNFLVQTEGSVTIRYIT